MKREIKFAIKKTVPIMLGYIFMGVAFGLLLQSIGYGPLWAFFISLFVYAGSMQFVLIGILSGGWAILQTIIMTFSVNSRHMFYGLSFLNKFKQMGKLYPYMIFSLTDETYALFCSLNVPRELNEKKTMALIAIFDHCYWILGCTAGATIGELITLSTKGIDFTMTALFVVIFVDQWRTSKNHIPALIGAVCGTLSILIFGGQNFILPAMIGTIGIFIFAKKYIEKREV